MIFRPRLVTHVVLLLVALLSIAGLFAGHTDCEDDCHADCGSCVFCCPAGLLAAAATLAPTPTVVRSFAAGEVSASATAARAIEHVPLRFA